MIKAGFIALPIVLAIILYLLAVPVYARAFPDEHLRNKWKRCTAWYLLIWLGYVGGISLTGIFVNDSLPPRMPLLVAPAFISFLWIFTRKQFRQVIAATPAWWPVFLQSFRIVVELLIYGCVVDGILPKAASFAGYNFDIVIGITAPIMGYFLLRERKTKYLLLAWNIVGLATLAVVVFILITHAYFFGIWGQSESILKKGFGLFPYTYLAGFLMPLAVFLHIFSIIRTRQQ